MKEKVFNVLVGGLLPPGMNAYIAGGYAACPQRAEDIDLWVRVSDADDLPVVREQLLDHFKGLGLEHTTLEDRREYKDNYGEFVGGVMKVAKIPYSPLDVHVMVTDMRPGDLIEQFDISTHMVAYDGKRVYTCWMTTELTEDPLVWKDTPTTDARLEKIRNRYADLRTNGQR